MESVTKFMLTTDQVISRPSDYDEILAMSRAINFSMCSDQLTGSMLRTLASAKPGARILELGTGTGLSLSWIASGADRSTSILSIDNDPQLIAQAKTYFDKDNRVELMCRDAADWLRTYDGPPFDLIFADAWPGKFDLLEETLDLLAPAGIYVIDDLLPQSNWPEGHQEKVSALIEKLEAIKNLHLTKLNWSTGLIIATKLNR